MQLFVEMTNMEQILRPLKGMDKITNLAVNSALRRAGQAMRTRLAQGISKESFLKSGSIRGDIKKPVLDAGMVSVTVGGKMHGADSFKLIPKRITAKKGMRSKDWPAAAYQLGPRVPVFRPHKAFVLNTKEGNLRMFQRIGKTYERVLGASAQYFSVFRQVRVPVLERGREVFEKRLMHEVEFRLGKMK